MIKTINEAFNTFKSNIEITGLQKETVSTRQNSVREVVEKDRKVLDSFLTGSYSRSTMIAPLSEADIDIFIILDPEYYEIGGQGRLLDLTKSTLLKTYTETPKISRNGQAVTITFTDFIVDVVPAFYKQGGGYLIPDSINKIWISTDPKVHVDFISQENKNHEGNLIPLIKMLKTWNKNNGGILKSFYLELIIANILKGVRISSFSSGVRYILDKARDYIGYKIKDPAGLGEGFVSGLNGYSNEKILSIINRDYQKCLKAENFERLDKMEEAIKLWKEILGERFPAYG